MPENKCRWWVILAAVPGWLASIVQKACCARRAKCVEPTVYLRSATPTQTVGAKFLRCAARFASVALLVGGWPHFAAAETTRPRVLVMGDSIAAGYGLDPSEAFPALLQRLADEKGLPAEVINAGLSGETSAGGVRRIDWLLKQRLEIFVLELGGNDALRGLALDETERNLIEIIGRVRGRYPKATVVLAGMKAPPNLGPDFTERFEGIYPKVASTTGAILIPFVLEGVGGVAELNQPDGIHPTAEGQRIIATTVWRTLEPLLGVGVKGGEDRANDAESKR